MTALRNKCYSGCHKATEEEDDRETLEKEIWRGKCGQRTSGLAGGRWRRQHRTELGGDEWSVAYASLGATRHPNRQINGTITNHNQIVGKVSDKTLLELGSDFRRNAFFQIRLKSGSGQNSGRISGFNRI